MRAYETTFIMVPTLDAEGFQGEVDKLKELIGSHGGTITAEKEWGRRRLAYPILKNSEGIYHILRFDFETEHLSELDRWFKLNENVLRAIILLDEGGTLDFVGQVSEYEERGHRDSRERRGDRFGSRSPERRPSDSGRSESSPTVSTPAPPKDEAPAKPVAEPVAAAESAAPESGGEDKVE